MDSLFIIDIFLQKTHEYMVNLFRVITVAAFWINETLDLPSTIFIYFTDWKNIWEIFLSSQDQIKWQV